MHAPYSGEELWALSRGTLQKGAKAEAELAEPCCQEIESKQRAGCWFWMGPADPEAPLLKMSACLPATAEQLRRAANRAAAVAADSRTGKACESTEEKTALNQCWRWLAADARPGGGRPRLTGLLLLLSLLSRALPGDALPG